MTANSNPTPTKGFRNKFPICGTYSGYGNHVKNKTEICQLCRDARSAYRREYYKKYPEKKRAMDIRYQEAHPGQRDKYDKKYREANREKTRAASTKWLTEHPERNREISRKRRALKLTNRWEPYTESQVLEIYGTNCYLCSHPINLTTPRSIGKNKGWQLALHIDHVIPIIAGGSDTLDNIRPAHAICNMKKGAKMVEDFDPELNPDLFEDEAVELEDLDYDAHALDEEEEDWEDS